MTRVEGNAGPPANDHDLGRALKLAWSLPSADFYATADLATAKRIGGIVWLIGWVVAVVLLPVAPPTEHVGDVGWVFVAISLLGTLALVYRLTRMPDRVTPNELLLSSYLALAYLALLVWLGGANAPYEQLFVLTVLYTCAVHPPRRLAAYLPALVVSAGGPTAHRPPGPPRRPRAVAHPAPSGGPPPGGGPFV